MPAYMLLIVEDPAQRGTRTDAEGRAVFGQMVDYAAQLKQRGVLKAVESLTSPNEGAARVQVRGGQARLVDGPFAEAKEMVGGFFLVDVADKAEAVMLARECPAARWATVEVRAVGPCFT
ncbi:MAG TPA: YciI family protein [Ramlibacter sp.]